MFWIGLCVLFLVIFGVFFYLELEKIDTEMYLPTIFLFVFIVTTVVTLCFLNFGPSIREEYNVFIVEK